LHFLAVRCKWVQCSHAPKSLLGGGKVRSAFRVYRRNREVSKVSRFTFMASCLKSVCSGGWRVTYGDCEALDPWPAIRFREVVRSQFSNVFPPFRAIPQPKICSRGKRKKLLSLYTSIYERRNHPHPYIAPAGTWLDWRPQLNNNSVVHRYRFKTRQLNYAAFAIGEAAFLFN